jgi:four helix bundle protein
MSREDKGNSQFSVFSPQQPVGGRCQLQDFKKLKVWEKGHVLTLDVYRLTARFPKDELYGLTSQIRRAAASVPAHIAEGCGRGGRAELARFLVVAMGSASELEYHLLLAHDLKFLEHAEDAMREPQVIEVKQMLSSFIQKLRVPVGKLRRLKTED